jgi:hypothetical protein
MSAKNSRSHRSGIALLTVLSPVGKDSEGSIARL